LRRSRALRIPFGERGGEKHRLDLGRNIGGKKMAALHEAGPLPWFAGE
jgi:hypothetical protein